MSSELHNLCGEIYQALGQFDKAKAAYKNALAFKSDFAEAHFGIGRIFHKQNIMKKAIEAYQNALDINPANTAILIIMGLHFKNKEC